MKLTDEQKDVIVNILKFNKQVVTLGGFAGSGKSTVVQHLSKALPNFAVCAYTGKAADVLRKKGIADASTIHSLIYKPVIDANGQVSLDSQGNPVFGLAQALACQGIIVDEASMISAEIHNDLVSFGLPIIYVGDHGQLEPISNDKEPFNMMKNPDYKLETIHRNAGPIAHFAEWIRKGNKPLKFDSNSDQVVLISKRDINYNLTSVDQIICAYNKTRVSTNIKVRAIKGYDDSKFIHVGEKVMCLRNNKERALFNGMQGIVKYIGPQKNHMTFDTNGLIYDVFFDPKQLNQEKYNISYKRDDPDPFDFAYTVTCHKCQGSEFDDVMVLEQVCEKWDHKRWAYTAASRAKKTLLWAYA